MNVLLQADEIARRRWRMTGIAGKVLLTFAITILVVVAVAGFLVWAAVSLVKGLVTGRAQNLSLYFPARRRR